MHYNCLIVDDETDLAKMTCEYFEMFDVTCACVETAGECENFLKENKVDVILMVLNIGGDDYIKKPCALSVLLAKVKVIMKRMVNQPQTVTDSKGIISVDSGTMRVYVNQREVQLKAREFKLFQCLFENRRGL